MNYLLPTFDPNSFEFYKKILLDAGICIDLLDPSHPLASFGWMCFQSESNAETTLLKIMNLHSVISDKAGLLQIVPRKPNALPQACSIKLLVETTLDDWSAVKQGENTERYLVYHNKLWRPVQSDPPFRSDPILACSQNPKEECYIPRAEVQSALLSVKWPVNVIS